MKYRIALAVFVISITAPAVYAVTSDNPEMIWLTLDPGGRPGGMGRSFTAVADDVNATYWNPAGLARLENRNIMAMHQPRGVAELEGMFYDYIAFSYPTEKFGTFGGSMAYLDLAKSPRTTEEGVEIGQIHSYDITPWVSWGYPLLPNLDVGVNLKFANQHLDTGVNTFAWMFDFGSLYHLPVRAILTDDPEASAMKLGLTVINIGPDITDETEGDEGETISRSTPLPRMIRFGVSYKFMNDKLNDLIVSAECQKFLMNFDGEVRRDIQGDKVYYVDESFYDKLHTELSEMIYAFGTEYWYADIVAVRMGYYYDFYGEITAFDMGIGVRYMNFGFDYSRVYEGVFEYGNRFSLSYAF